MKTRFNLLIPVVGAQGNRLARVNLDTSKLTNEDRELILEHFFIREIETSLKTPTYNWKEGDFINFDAKWFVPSQVQDETNDTVSMDNITFEELKSKLEEKEQKKQFLSNLSQSLKQKAEVLLQTYSLDEVRGVFKELRARN